MFFLFIFLSVLGGYIILRKFRYVNSVMQRYDFFLKTEVVDAKKMLRPGAKAPGRSLSGIKNNMRFEKPIVNVYFRGRMI